MSGVTQLISARTRVKIRCSFPCTPLPLHMGYQMEWLKWAVWEGSEFLIPGVFKKKIGIALESSCNRVTGDFGARWF